MFSKETASVVAVAESRPQRFSFRSITSSPLPKGAVTISAICKRCAKPVTDAKRIDGIPAFAVTLTGKFLILCPFSLYKAGELSAAKIMLDNRREAGKRHSGQDSRR